MERRGRGAIQIKLFFLWPTNFRRFLRGGRDTKLPYAQI